ncbi:hypothetical protein [Klebsiella pneumoniae]|nr:hypothetical protein [Klebsiella pneumoniae]WKH14995.1 hypothetical protein QYQ43_07710 [Klebsiella pneumoniae]
MPLAKQLRPQPLRRDRLKVISQAATTTTGQQQQQQQQSDVSPTDE